MLEADMKKKICPIMSSARGDVVAVVGGTPGFVLCQGSACLAFGSRPTYVYLGEDGKVQPHMGKLKKFSRDDDGDEIKSLLANGWRRGNPAYTDTYLQREGEPNCWCDAMAGNAQCGYEAP